MIKRHLCVTIGIASAFVLAASAAGAQEVSASVRRSAACAPPPAAAPLPDRVLRVVGGQSASARTVFGAGELVVVDGGTGADVAVGQQYYIRRGATFGPGRDEARPGPVTTVGWLRIVAVNETTSIAHVDAMCDGIFAGDYLEEYAETALPAGMMAADTTGHPDFAAAGRVMYGQEERVTGATGDFMIVDVGGNDGAAAGDRFAIYRDVQVADVPLVAIGEAIVVSVSDETSLVRITRARDAVRTGDLLVPRRDGQPD
jgi:hypothetical protein